MPINVCSFFNGKIRGYHKGAYVPVAHCPPCDFTADDYTTYPRTPCPLCGQRTIEITARWRFHATRPLWRKLRLFMGLNDRDGYWETSPTSKPRVYK